MKLNDQNVQQRKKKITTLTVLFNLPVLLWVLLQSCVSVLYPCLALYSCRKVNEGPHLQQSSAIKYDLTRNVQKKSEVKKLWLGFYLMWKRLYFSVGSSLDIQTLFFGLMGVVGAHIHCEHLNCQESTRHETQVVSAPQRAKVRHTGGNQSESEWLPPLFTSSPYQIAMTTALVRALF